MRRAVAALFVLVAAAFVTAGVRSEMNAGYLNARAHRIHAQAVKARVDRSHDERLDLRNADTDARIGWLLFSAAAACLFGTILALRGDRPVIVTVQAPSPRAQTPSDNVSSYVARLSVRSSPIEVSDPSQLLARKKSGHRGERLVREALAPLESEGWSVVESSVEVIFPDGQMFGDVDILLISPTGTAYSIDAKNGTERVWYDERRDLVVFDRGWHGKTKIRPPYPASRADFLARWVHITYGYERVVPVMCFTQTMDLRWEHLVSSMLYLVKIENVCRTLRGIDHRRSKPVVDSNNNGVGHRTAPPNDPLSRDLSNPIADTSGTEETMPSRRSADGREGT